MFENVSAISAAAELQQLSALYASVCADGNAESAHQLRVTSARLRVWLSLGGWRVLRDDLGWLRKQVAELRDLDVQLSQQPPDGTAAQLTEERERAFRELAATLENERASALFVALKLLPAAPRAVALETVERLSRGALAHGARRRWRNGDREQLHDLRRSVRRVRYALEWFGEAPGSLEQLQRTLGLACDRFVAIDNLTRSSDAEASGFAKRLNRELDRHIEQSQQQWDDVRPKLEEIADAALRYSTR